jgi:Alcohol dehydrogenase GroES-like domain
MSLDAPCASDSPSGQANLGARRRVCAFPARAQDCKDSVHERAAQPDGSSQALRRFRRAGGGRRSPADGRGEMRVRVLASSVQCTDVLIRRHLYPQTMYRRPPFVMGYDVVGEIDQLGDGVRGFRAMRRRRVFTSIPTASHIRGNARRILAIVSTTSIPI